MSRFDQNREDRTSAGVRSLSLKRAPSRARHTLRGRILHVPLPPRRARRGVLLFRAFIHARATTLKVNFSSLSARARKKDIRYTEIVGE